MIELTVNELSDNLKMDRMTVYGMLKYLEAVGKAKVVRTVRRADGKGKPSSVYQLNNKITLEFIKE